MTSIVEPEEDLARKYDLAIARRVFTYIGRHKQLAAIAVGLALVIALVSSLPPYILGRAVDKGIIARDPGALTWLAALYFGVMAARLLLSYAGDIAISLLSEAVTRDLRTDLSRKITYQSLSFFSREPVGRIVTRIMNDAEGISGLFAGGSIAILGDFFFFFVTAAILFWLDWRLALLTLIVVPALWVSLFRLNRRIRETSRELRRLLARVAAYLAETLNGVRVVQLFGREAENARRFRALNDDHLRVQLRSMHPHALYVATITAITNGAIALLIWRGGYASLEGRLEIGLFVAFVGYAQALFLPIRDIAEKYAHFQSAMASAERVFKWLDEPVEVVSPAAPKPLPSPLRGEIEFKDVSFQYPARRGTQERPWALRNVSFRIRPGERVAIVGHTGAGKSTLVNLLARFHDVTDGAVLVDGVDVRELDERALRREIAVVLQDVFVFAGSVVENISLGEPRITEEAARKAAVAVRADSWIARLPGGYGEEMRERGATLSTGQKQLLSFARALAFDPRVLILDEATASIDPETEALLQDAIRTMLQGRTSIVIAHRLATIQDVDRVLVFHKGELREEGTPRQLIEKGGIFARLWKLQQGGRI